MRNSYQQTQSKHPNILSLPKGGSLGLIKIEAGRILHEHEVITITKLLRFGHDVLCQAESKLIKSADIIWQGESWEIKNIKGKSKYTLGHSLKKAKQQSRNIILDLSDSQISLERSLGKIKTLLDHNKKIIKILVISKQKYCIINRVMLV